MGIKIPWQIWACAGIVSFLVFSHWYSYQKGAASVQLKWDAAVIRGKAIVQELEADQGKVTTRIEYKYIDRWRTIHEKGDTITKLVPHYIPVDSCDLPPGFRVLHDAAATGTIPGGAAGVSEPTVPVADTSPRRER